MRVKYNERYSQMDTGTGGRSNIYLKYRDQVETLLAPSIDSYRNYGFDELYVPSIYHKDLEPFLNKRETNSFIYLEGLTGTGKSSLLKYVFRHFDNSSRIDGTTLVIPFACDNNIGDKNGLKPRLACLFFAVTDKLIEAYGLEDFRDNTEEFRDYIKDRRESFSVNQDGWRKITAEELIDQLYNEDTLELSIFALKYSMAQEGNPIDNVVFIMDDVESVGLNLEIYPIYLANKINSCLKNRTNVEKKKWCNTTIVACRHYVFRLLCTMQKDKTDEEILREVGIDRSTMESFSSGTEIDIKEFPPIKDIINKRKESILRHLSAEEKEDFLEICKVLDYTVDTIGQLLLALNINDYRRTFASLKRVIFNKRWLQRFDSVSGAFKIGTAEENYFKNKPNVIRAVAMGESDVYFGKSSLIPNLLENSNEGGDLWKLLVVSLFANDKTHDWDFSMDLESLKASISSLFGEDAKYVHDFNTAVEMLISDRLLLRGKKEEQRDSIDLDYVNLDNVKYVYPSDALKLLWKELSMNSILFELFVDDIWIESPYRKDSNAARRYIQFNMPNYKECLYYLEYLVSVEKDIRRKAVNIGRKDEYIHYFTETPVTGCLYEGLYNSFNNYFKEKLVGDILEQRMLEGQLADLKMSVEECTKILD